MSPTRGLCPRDAPVRPANTITRLDTSGGRFRGRIVITTPAYFAAEDLRATSGLTTTFDQPYVGAAVALGADAARSLDVAAAEEGVAIWVNGRVIPVLAVLAPSGRSETDNTAYFTPAALQVLADQLESSWIVHTEQRYAEPLALAIPSPCPPTTPAGSRYRRSRRSGACKKASTPTSAACCW